MNMIKTAEEFIRLRNSDKPEEYRRAATEAAETGLWIEIISQFPEMKVWVSHNKTVPLEVLDALAHDPDRAVRLKVATKNKLSDDLYRLLASDADDGVRQRISFNKNTPRDVLERLSRDTNNLVSVPALERLERLTKLTK